ncbi:SAGA-associated factor 11 [Picochlorum sp. SENEW3]|nr:SAGA-associated factor 11 [Picochlorum sp. SENEW3]
MALVKAKDIPHETLALQKRIEFVKDLKACLNDDSKLVTETVKLYSELIDDIINDVCLAVHRDIVLGIEDSSRGDREHGETTKKRARDGEEDPDALLEKAALHYGTPKMLGVQMGGSKGARDMFGNMIQPVALDQVSCPSCGRKIASGRFAPHLEKCMGLGGRQARKNVAN